MAINFLNNGYFAGNVGIGTTSPDTKLHVEGNVLIDAYNQGEDNGLFFREGFLTIDQPSITVWDMSNAGASPDGLSINSNDGIRFRENGGEVARFKDGNFGIGTTAPTAKLHVAGSNADATDKPTMISESVFTVKPVALNSGNLSFAQVDSGNSIGMQYTNGSGTANWDISMQPFGGNVGIGTTSPIMKLQVVGDIYANSGNVFIDTGRKLVWGNSAQWIEATNNTSMEFSGGGSSVDMTLLANGNVGIGVTGPNRLLDIRGEHGTTRARLFYNNGTAINNAYIDMWASEPGSTYNGSGIGGNINGSPYYGRHVTEQGQSFIRFENGELQLWAGAAAAGTASVAVERLTILAGGNVGIGTTSPGAKLDVAGTGNFTGLVSGITPVAAANFVTKAYADAGNARVTPATPSTITSTIVGETIEIAFNQSSTSNIDYYQVWSSDDGGDYGIIAQITPADFSSTMTVVDTTFVTGGTMSYRVFAVREGIYSTAGTTSKAYTVSALSVTDMTVVNLNTAYYIQYEKPTSRFIDHVEIYMDSQTTSAALSRSNATIVYSGQNASYMRNVNTSSNFHQFWVEIVTS